MSDLKREIEKIHDKTDFKVEFAGVTQLGEFKYSHGGSVQPGMEYHIHYTNDKKEVFMTGAIHNSNSKIIKKVSDIRKSSVEKISIDTTRNTLSVFSKHQKELENKLQ